MCTPLFKSQTANGSESASLFTRSHLTVPSLRPVCFRTKQPKSSTMQQPPQVFHYPPPINSDMANPPPTVSTPSQPMQPTPMQQPPAPNPPQLPPAHGLPPSMSTPAQPPPVSFPQGVPGPMPQAPILAQAHMPPPPGAAPPLVPMYPPQMGHSFPYAPPPYVAPMFQQIPSGLNIRPQNVKVEDIISPEDLFDALPVPYETILDRDLARLVDKANKYGGEAERDYNGRKFEKYVFLAGLLLANRGLPPSAVPDDPKDVYIRLCNFYLSNPTRLGSSPDIVLANNLKRRHHHHHRRRRRTKKDTDKKRSASAGKRSRSRASSTSASSDWE